MAKITRSRLNRAFQPGSTAPGVIGRRDEIIVPQGRIIINNPYNKHILPFVIAAPGELINWRTREKKAMKRMKKTGSAFPFPEELYLDGHIKR